MAYLRLVSVLFTLSASAMYSPSLGPTKLLPRLSKHRSTPNYERVLTLLAWSSLQAGCMYERLVKQLFTLSDSASWTTPDMSLPYSVRTMSFNLTIGRDAHWSS